MMNLVKRLCGILLGAVQLLLGFLVWAAGLLASSTQTDQYDDELGSSIRGGDLNFRTGKFDDGTDPAGWYGRD